MKRPLSIVFLTMMVLGLSTANAGDAPPFGGPDSVKYANNLWQVLLKMNIVGANAIISKPYKGAPPHGAVLDTVERTIKVDGHRGNVIVKRNYGGKDVSVAKVTSDPGKYLKAITVMFRREKGYDPANKDWFWVKYSAKGDILKNPKGMSLAGRVAKGMKAGCIACHSAAPGGDLVFKTGW